VVAALLLLLAWVLLVGALAVLLLLLVVRHPGITPQHSPTHEHTFDTQNDIL
jgi:hypothetical protein